MLLSQSAATALRDGIRNTVLGFVLIVSVGTIATGCEYAMVRDQPTEVAVVETIERSGTREACGGRRVIDDTPGVRIGYRSTTPRPDLPDRFVVVGCPDDATVGEKVELRRTGPTEDDLHLWPVTTIEDVVLGSVLVALVVTAVLASWAAVETVVREAFARRRPDYAPVELVLRSRRARRQNPPRHLRPH